MSNNSTSPDVHTLQVQALFVQHQKAVLAYVLSIEPNLHDAEEIVQETFVTVSRKASNWTSGTNFLAWVCTIARFNTLHFQRTRSRRKARLAGDVVILLAEYFENDVSVFQSRVTDLRQCLRKLSPKARDLVERRYNDGSWPEQIAEDVGWTANAVRVALTRARNTLRECLERVSEGNSL